MSIANHCLRVLVLGGYGNFGARIVRALAADPLIELIIAGRSETRARQLAASLEPTVQTMSLDASDAKLAQRLSDAKANLVIHTAGPFQQQDYAEAHACAQAGAHYIDLADGRRFVCDFPAAMNAAFEAAQRCSVSGASTVPALSSAVVEYLSAGWSSIDRIDICIAPAQSAPRGVATLAGVLTYCGEAIDVWQAGRWQPAIGWASPSAVRFARMKPRRAALCDIPDLGLFPARYAVRDAVEFRAALEVPLAQQAFAALAQLRRWRLLARPQALAPLMHRWGTLLDRWGSRLGGMYVVVTGRDAQGKSVVRRWDVAADNDHGPEIPCMAAILLARRLARGLGPAAGAHTAAGLLTLDEFAPEFARWGMVVDIT